ncbi:tRNA pseudouridine synthase B [gamma proteobacterium HdN1]|nr:tRNA pseudouridine synthase B [gamma proteobacterium HdN1]
MSNRRKSRGRALDGILVLDKPDGMTSNAALQRLKRIYGAEKAGHTGALDPLATGVLPICFGEATKFSQYLLDADKAYEVTAKLGVQTATGDSEGEIVDRRPTDGVTLERILDVLPRFRGPVSQVPSMYSALKHQGQPLYKLARQGIEVPREARTVQIYSLELVHFGGDELSLSVRCSKGTYIRTLVEDIGLALDSYAHVVQLRRTAAGPYTLEDAHSFDEISAQLEQGGHVVVDKLLKPTDSSVSDWPALTLTENTAYYLKTGQAVRIPQAPADGWVRLLGVGGEFIGIGEVIDDGRIAPRRLVKTS